MSEMSSYPGFDPAAPIGSINEACGAKTRYAASYERKSTSDPYGIDEQYLINKQKAADEGFIIPDDPRFRFSDDDTSGVTKSRRGFDRLKKVIEGGDAPFERVYVKDRTRLGRWDEPRMHFYYEVHFQENGVVVRYVDEDDSAADGDDDGRATARFLKGAVGNLAASTERKRLIRRIRGGVRSRVINGFYPGSIATYATERRLANKYDGTLIQEAAIQAGVRMADCSYRLVWASDGRKQVVAEIFERYEASTSMTEIAKSLNARGVPSPAAAGTRGVESDKIWTGHAVFRILRNALYVGDLYWGLREGDPRDRAVPAHLAKVDGDEPIVVRDFLPDAPVPRDRWETVQRMLDDNGSLATQRRANKSEFPLSGILKCAACGAVLYGFTSTKQQGNRRRYYRHTLPWRAGTNDACPNRNRYVRADSVEPVADDTVNTLLRDDALNALASQELNRRLDDASEQRRTQTLDRLVSEAQELKRASTQAGINQAKARNETEREIHDGVVHRLSEELRALTSRINDLQSEHETIKRVRAKVEQNIAKQVRLNDEYQSCDPTIRKRVVRLLIESIILEFDAEDVEIRIRAA